jgi:hypothetical protein
MRLRPQKASTTVLMLPYLSSSFRDGLWLLPQRSHERPDLTGEEPLQTADDLRLGSPFRHTARDAEAIRELQEMAAAMQAELLDIPAYVETDVAFHIAIGKASGNEILAHLPRSITSSMEVWAKRVLESSAENIEHSLAMHMRILSAVRLGDAEAAREAMADHVSSANDVLRKTLQDADRGPSPGGE